MFENSTKVETRPIQNEPQITTSKTKVQPKAFQKKKSNLGSPEQEIWFGKNGERINEKPKNSGLLPDPDSDLINYNPLDPKNPRKQSLDLPNANSSRRLHQPKPSITGRDHTNSA